MRHCKNKSNISIVKDYLAGVSPCPTVGYTGPSKTYKKEGEIWEDASGIKWQKINGRRVKLTKSQGDIIRDAIGNQKCNCGLEIKWGNKFDRLFFSKTGMCQDCLIKYETNLRIIGAFDSYQKYKILSNAFGFLTDAKAKLKETIRILKTSDTTIDVLCNSEGFREKFCGTNKDKLLEDATLDLKNVNQHLADIKKEKKELKENLKAITASYKVKLYV